MQEKKKKAKDYTFTLLAKVIYLVQSSNSSESESRLWARAEELKDRDGGNQFSARCSLQIDDRVSSLVNDHLGFVSETEIKSKISRPTVVERSKASVFRLRSWMMRSRVRNPVSTSQTSSFGSGTAREKLSSSSSRKNEKAFV